VVAAQPVRGTWLRQDSSLRDQVQPAFRDV